MVVIGGHERGAHPTPGVGTNRDVLQIRVGRGEPTGGGHALVEASVDAAGARVDELGQGHAGEVGVLQLTRRTGDALNEKMKEAVLPDLVQAARDPDEDVRNNAMRAIAVMADYAQDHPELGIEIDYTPFIEMLNSPIWSDRNKAIAVIHSLASGGDPALLMALREEAFDSLLEMARWQSPGHARWAFFTLGRVLGLKENDIRERWTDENRTAWLDEVGKAKGAGGDDDR